MYTPSKSRVSSMPLLMHFTPRTKVQESQDEKFIYDELHQVVEYTMAGVKGTTSQRSKTTKKKSGSGYIFNSDTLKKKDD